MEIYFGLFSNKYLQENVDLLHKRQDQINGLLHHFIILQFDRNAAIKSAQITSKLSIIGQKIDFRDGMIAGTGLSNGITKVITHNVSHFDRIDGIKIISKLSLISTLFSLHSSNI
jgi:predicted nucleic acid-binding protein